MKARLFLLLLTMTGFSTLTNAQDLGTYQWENRLVLLLSADANNPQLKEQLVLFEQDLEGLKERKLRIISATPSAFRLSLKGTWKNGPLIYKQYHRKRAFEFILIGLDGGVKLRKNEVVSTKSLYRIIDSMPMRAAEMRRKNN